MKLGKNKLKIQFCLCLTQEEKEKLIRLKKHGGHRKVVDLMYKMTADNFQHTFNESFF